MADFDCHSDLCIHEKSQEEVLFVIRLCVFKHQILQTFKSMQAMREFLFLTTTTLVHLVPTPPTILTHSFKLLPVYFPFPVNSKISLQILEYLTFSSSHGVKVGKSRRGEKEAIPSQHRVDEASRFKSFQNRNSIFTFVKPILPS